MCERRTEAPRLVVLNDSFGHARVLFVEMDVGTHRHPERIVKFSRNRICWLIDIFIMRHFVFPWSTALRPLGL
jgi:hypothetical protein